MRFLLFFYVVALVYGGGAHYVQLYHRKGTTCTQADYIEAQYMFGKPCTVGDSMCHEAVSPFNGPVSSICVATMEDLPFSAAVGALFPQNDTACSELCTRARIWMLNTCEHNMTVTCENDLIVKTMYDNEYCNGTVTMSKNYTTGSCIEASPETWGFKAKFMCI